MRRQLSLSALPAVRPQSQYQSNYSEEPRRHSNLRERYRAFHDEVFAYVMSRVVRLNVCAHLPAAAEDILLPGRPHAGGGRAAHGRLANVQRPRRQHLSVQRPAAIFRAGSKAQVLVADRAVAPPVLRTPRRAAAPQIRDAVAARVRTLRTIFGMSLGWAFGHAAVEIFLNNPVVGGICAINDDIDGIGDDRWEGAQRCATSCASRRA